MIDGSGDSCARSKVMRKLKMLYFFSQTKNSHTMLKNNNKPKRNECHMKCLKLKLSWSVAVTLLVIAEKSFISLHRDEK